MGIIPAVAALLIAQAPSGPCQIDVNVATVPSEEIHLGDPVFVRVTAKNAGKTVVKIPPRFTLFLSTLKLEVIQGSGDYVYIARGGDASGAVQSAELAPGEAWIVAYEIVEMPPTSDLEHDFWTGIASESAAAELRVTLAHDQVASQKPARHALRIRQRPANEMRFLAPLYAESAKRRAAGARAALPKSMDWCRPQPNHVGLPSLRYDDEIAEGLLRTEHELSPGPLRDIVHLTKTMRAIYETRDGDTRRTHVGALLRWLDSLPEIERHCLCEKLVSWYGHSGPADPAYFEFADGILGRLPERCFGHDNYRGYWQQQLAAGNSALAAYLERQRGEKSSGGEQGASSLQAGPAEAETMDNIDVAKDSRQFRGGYLWLLERSGHDTQPVSVSVQNLLKQITTSKVPTAQEARQIAVRDKLQRSGLLAQEEAEVVSLVRSGVDSAAFVSRGDLIWIVQIRLIGGSVTQEAWINSRTGVLRWMLPLEKPQPDASSVESDGGKPPPDPREAVEALRKLHVEMSSEGNRIVSATFPDYVALVDLGFEGYDYVDADLEHVRGLAELRQLSVAGCQRITDEGIKHLRGLSQIRKLNLMYTQVSDAGLENLQGMTQLEKLDLGVTRVTGAGLKHVKGARRLQSLSLGGTAVADAGLEYLESFTQLERLDLAGAKVTDAGLSHLRGLSQLRWLRLGGGNLTDAGLPHLAALTQLRQLYLGATKVSDAGLVHLKPFAELDWLELSLTRVTGRGFEHLDGLTNLKCLYLRGTGVTDAGLRQICGLAGLTMLDLESTQITDAGLEHLGKLSELNSLELSRTNITDAGLKHLGGLAKLRYLHVSASHVSEAAVARLNQALPHCEILRR